jgi:hypothetical protein
MTAYETIDRIVDEIADKIVDSSMYLDLIKIHG